MSESAVRLRSLDGMRAIAMLWIVTFHSFYLLGYVMDPHEAWAFFVQPQNNLILQGVFGLDVLFVLSGFLIGGYIFRQLAAGRFSLRTFFIRRAARIYPAYIVVLALYIVFIPLNRGSVWANLLMVNNYLPVGQQTMPWTWTNGIEGQYYILFPLVALLIPKPRWILAFLITALLASMAVSAAVVVRDGITFGFPSPYTDTAAYNHVFDVYYDKTPLRIGAIICGLIAAYFYEFGTLRAFFLQRARLAFALFLGAVALLAGILSVHWYETSAAAHLQPAFMTAYLSFDKVLFSAAAAYVMLYALSGTSLSRGVSAALGARIWYWPAELSYSVYLLHPIIIIALYAYFLHPAHMTMTKMIAYLCVVVPTAYLFSLGLYVGVERPIRRLARFYTDRRRSLTPAQEMA